MAKFSLQKIAPFYDARIASVFLLGILSGLPWLMIGSALTLWLKEANISRTGIGYAGLIFGVYAINFLWSPVIDRFQTQRFKRLGPRRVWVLGAQLIIVGACLGLSLFTPAESAKIIVAIALVIAIASATQDMAIDAFRVDAFAVDETESISAAAAASTAGWWTGYAGLGLIPLFLSDHGFTWPQLYPIMGLMSALAAMGVFVGHAPLPQPQAAYDNRRIQYLARVLSMAPLVKLVLFGLVLAPLALAIWAAAGSPGLTPAVSQYPLYVPFLVALAMTLVVGTMVFLAKAPSTTAVQKATWLDALPTTLLANVIAPLEDFLKRNGLKLGLTLLAFIVIFKLGESFLGRMSILFYKEVGFSNSEIGTYSKMVTWWVTLAAAIPFALLNARLGLVRGLFIAGVCMAASNLLFLVIAAKGPDLNWFLITVVVDGITQAWSTIAFVAFISALCSHTFSATQYALMASLGTLGRSTLAAFGGQMVDALGGNWSIFFILTTVMVIPGLLMLLWLRKPLRNHLSNG